MNKTRVVALQPFLGNTLQPPQEYTILGQKGNMYVAEGPLGYQYKIIGELIPGQSVLAVVQSTYIKAHRKKWMNPDPECQLANSFVRGHPEKDYPLCLRMLVRSVRGLNFGGGGGQKRKGNHGVHHDRRKK